MDSENNKIPTTESVEERSPGAVPATSRTDNQFSSYRDCDTRSLASSKRTNVTKSSSSSSSKQTVFQNDEDDDENEASSEDDIDVELYERYNRTRLPTKTAAARSANRHMDIASSSSSSSSDEESLPHELPSSHRHQLYPPNTSNTSNSIGLASSVASNSSSDATMVDIETQAATSTNTTSTSYSNMALYPNMMRRNRSASITRQQNQQNSQQSPSSSTQQSSSSSSSSLLFLSINNNTTTSQSLSTTSGAIETPANNLRSTAEAATTTSSSNKTTYFSTLHTTLSSSTLSSMDRPFEPKSNMFAQVLEQAEKLLQLNGLDSNSDNKSNSIPLKTKTTSVTCLEKLAYLYSNYESYHSIMMLPVSVNFKDCSPTLTQHNHFKRQRHDSTYCTERPSTSEPTTSEIKKNLKQVINTIFNSDCECNLEDEEDDQSSRYEDSEDDESYENDEYRVDEKQLESVVPTIKNSTENKEFHLCPLCSHCLYEPITLVCGCTYCKACLHEHQHMVRQVYEKRKRELDKDQEEQIKNRLIVMRNNAGLKRKHSSNVAGRRPTTSLLSEAGNLVANLVTNSSRSAALIYNDTEDEEEEEDEEQAILDKRAASLEEFLNQCYHCSKVHEQNCNLEYTRPNVLVAKLVDKFWSANLENRRLRNDIRQYVSHSLRTRLAKMSSKEIVLDEKEMAKYESMLVCAYNLDPSNHLLLADLFMLNFFLNGDNSITSPALKYAEMACDLRPDWSFAHYMKMINHLKINDINQVKISLEKCIRLEPTCNYQLKLKLYQLITNSKSESSQVSLSKSDPLTENVSSLNYDTSKYVVVDSHLVKPVDLECSLCYRLLYTPVTTPCGHSFCMSCLERSLDHHDRCPLCKHTLADHLAERRRFKTTFLDSLIQTHYGTEYIERKRQYLEELKDIQSNENEIPIFVCTLALPFAPVPLHVYEPRYKLMLRRCIENETRCFGMCMYTELTPQRYTEYGCMLEIRNHQFTRDGRAILSTFGSKRFKVATSSMRDGYNIAEVEWIKDIRVENETEKNELQQLHDEVYRLAHTWYSYIPSLQKARIFDIYGFSELPEPESDIQSDNGPFWHWFFLNILPLDENLKYKFLSKTSLTVRLAQLKKIILILIAPYMNMLNSNNNNNNSNQSSNGSMPTSPSLSNNRNVPGGGGSGGSGSGNGGTSGGSSSSNSTSGGNQQPSNPEMRRNLNSLTTSDR